MKPILSIKSLRGSLLALAATGLSCWSFAAEVQPEPSWKVAGDLEEGCSCRAACPCWFKSLPSRMTCDGLQAIFVTKGHYGKTKLDGLAVAEFVQSPERQSMFESFGRWNFDYIYIDERADADQREALKQLAMHFFPAGASASREYRYVAISREINGAEHVTKVGNYGLCSGHLIEGGYGGNPKIVNAPMADPTHKEFLQGETTKLTYNDAGQNWNYEKSNYMRNQFKTDGKAYQKFEAELAKKLEQLKQK
jgi:hypothetical protein